MIMSYVMPFPILLTFNFLLAVKKLQNNSTLESRVSNNSLEEVWHKMFWLQVTISRTKNRK